MIQDTLFILKMFVLTVLIVLVMQIRVGDKTLENHFHYWVQHSIIVDYAEEAVAGGTALFRHLYTRIDLSVHSLFAKTLRKHDQKNFPVALTRHNGDSQSLDDGEAMDAREPKNSRRASRVPSGSRVNGPDENVQ